MYSISFLTIAFFGLVMGSDTDVNKQTENQISQLFFRNDVLKASKHVHHRNVPSFLKKLYKMQDRRSTFSQVSCIFSEYLKPAELSSSFSFDLSNIKNFPQANQVQLRAFKRRSKQRNPREFYYIHLYQMLNSTKNASQENNLKLISSRFVRNSRGEWLVYGITSKLSSRESLLNTATKLTFVFEVKAVRQRSKSKPVSIAKSGRKQPFMLLFFKKDPPQLPTEIPKSKLLSLDEFPVGKTRLPRASTFGGKDLCARRESLYIDFRRLGLTSIIAPRGFEAYYCDGACPIYSGNPNESLYSFLRNRYRLESGKQIPEACCVPTQLGVLNILYYSAQGSIDLGLFDGMTVESCGCR